MTPEGKVKQRVRDWLLDNMPGLWTYSAPGGSFGKAGTPDRLNLWRGIMFAIEIKRDRSGKVTDLQMKELLSIKRNGGISAVLYGFEEQKLNHIRDTILQRTLDWEAPDAKAQFRSVQLSDPSGSAGYDSPSGDD